ncbi:isopenicillin N synthase family dioxygenase [Myceligenerans indicum]|uniref:Isopenicillin N synthase family oxygenase n=1 Tax=Myceligenerans indicum TaxID=2593663 RepID=A0ABS1LLN1_9MICO|nr:isopenicillin N synthase family oxygenase [Myceligenerans indicum]MBL0887157.1 isopenicillin N synthase family oxygenase [Myceligenerans indicum]
MPAFHVPAIDITPYIANGTDAERADVACQVDEAARTVGFMQILGHGIPLEAWARLGRASDRFFELPLDVKKQYRAPAGVNRGYSPPRSERLSLSLGVEKAERMNDFFEAFNLGATTTDYPGAGLDPRMYPENIWPAESDTFQDDVELWMSHARSVARVMMRIFTDALGLPAGHFDAYTDHSLDVLRMNNYALPEGERVELDGDLIGMGEHTDFGIVTLLWADDVKGLQVLDADGGWNDVSPLPGALLVNLGDLTARWTNEQWKSTLHRVKPPVIDGRIRRRRSAAFFLDGNVDAVITTLPGCVAEGDTELYGPITVGEHIEAKLNGSRGLVNNTKDTGREARRVLAGDA